MKYLHIKIIITSLILLLGTGSLFPFSPKCACRNMSTQTKITVASARGAHSAVLSKKCCCQTTAIKNCRSYDSFHQKELVVNRLGENETKVSPSSSPAIHRDPIMIPDSPDMDDGPIPQYLSHPYIPIYLKYASLRF